MKITGPIPEHIRRLMSPEDRGDLQSPTMPEIQATVETAAEKVLQSQIMDYLRLHGVFAGRQRMDKKSTMALGWPDIVFAWHGVPIALEVKTANGKQTEEQRVAEAAMAKDGWRYYVVRSVAEVKAILEGVLKECV